MLRTLRPGLCLWNTIKVTGKERFDPVTSSPLQHDLISWENSYPQLFFWGSSSLYYHVTDVCHLVAQLNCHQLLLAFQSHMVSLSLYIRRSVKFIETISKWRHEVSNHLLNISYSFEEYSDIMVTFQRLPQVTLGIILRIELCLSCSPKPIFTLAVLVSNVGLCKYTISNIHFVGNIMKWGRYMSAYIYVYIWMKIYIKYPSVQSHTSREGHININKFVLSWTEQPITISRVILISQLRNFKLLLPIASIT